ncbi:PEP-CTERM sorting domain-containing protein [Pontiella sp.]|uniref:PEP-CTERM sorting domain-containing protein n=1 Tax=Pontiella sp. TaxID=2837462 RepID=UPI003564AF99
MKRINIAGLGLLVCCVGIQSQASIVYEGFDYTAGSTIPTQGVAADGWNGTWTDAAGSSNPFAVTTGQTFGSLPVTGGAAQRSSNGGKAAMSRTIDATAQSALTADGSTTYFSVLMNAKNDDVYAVAGAISGTIAFGDASLQAVTDSDGNPTIASDGNAVGVGFDGNSPSYDTVRLQGICYVDGVTQADTTGGLTVGINNLQMVMGKVEWGADGANDTVTLYSISDPSAGYTEADAFSTMSYDIDQSGFNMITIGDSQSSVFDEIRFGTSATDVGVIPEPATLGLVGAFGAGILFVRRRFMI